MLIHTTDEAKMAAVEDRVRVRKATHEPGLARSLSHVLIACVEQGASVGFMQPLDSETAEAFWLGMLDSAERGERILLVAEVPDSRTVVGTVQVILAMPPNQPHRGEIAKMLVHPDARHQGVGEALMRAAEAAAAEAGKTVLILDTASADAERLYERLGWQNVGVVPRYALGPRGGFVDTRIYYKILPDQL